MIQPADKTRSDIHDQCAGLVEHINLLRDFATTPGNAWLAKDELAKIHQITADIDKLLDQIDKN